MLNIKALQDEAKASFISELSKKIIFISTSCWESNLEKFLKQVNGMIVEAKKFDITKAIIFTDEEIKELTQDLKSLSVLGMKKQMNKHLISILKSKGLDDEVLVKCVASEEDLKSW